MDSREVSNLVERMFMFIEDKNYIKAEEYAERILDLNSKNANAYLGKLLVDYHLTEISDLATLGKNFTDNINYQRCIKFGDEDLICKLNQLLDDNNQFAKERQEQKKSTQEKAKITVKKIFKTSLPFFAAVVCIILVGIFVIMPIEKYNRAESLYYNKSYEEALEIYQSISFWKDSKKKADSCSKLIPTQNYVTYKKITVQFPSSIDYNVEVKDDTIYLSGSIRSIPSINTFLSYLVAPSNRSFYDRANIDNGCSAFIIENYATWNSQPLNLKFIRTNESNHYVAKYINQSNYYLDNSEIDTVFFNGETVLKGQYCDETKFYQTYFTIKVVVNFV